MRLFLSSQYFGNYAQVARKLAGDNNKAAYFRNAHDNAAITPEERNSSAMQKRTMFEDAGFEPEEIDLRDYFGKPEELREKLKGFGSIWADGGNTFILRRALAKSGLDKILIEMLEKDEIMYGGWSAGAMVMTPDITGSDWDESDDPYIVPEGYDSGVIWEGLAQVPFYIAPHVGNKRFGDKPDGMVKYYQSRNLSYYAINDDQAIVVNGDKAELLP